MRIQIVSLGLLAFASAAAAQDYAQFRVISAPDCVDASHMVPELDPAPINSTYLRVQHIGDPGTPELVGEIANPVTWNVGQFTGFFPPPANYVQAQRGFRDIGPPDPASAFQLWCNGAGFLINTRQFRHASPVTLGGPNVSVARDLAPPAEIFRNATSALTIDGYVRVPFVEYGTPPTTDGTAQVSFFYYAQDVTSGTTFAHVIALFDNRLPGVNGAGNENVSADAYTAFVTSPLLPTTAVPGTPTQYASVSPVSDTMHFQSSWSGTSYFRVHVPYEKFRAMLATLKAIALPAISARPQDYRVTLFGLLGEVFPGTDADHEVALGASVVDLKLSEAFGTIAALPVIEYYHAAHDHYFISARQADIEALDSGRLPGWTRTGMTFTAYPSFVAGTSAVCRYYLPPASGDSHFFSASAQECAEVAAKFPGFILEDPEVMYMALPDLVTGVCPLLSKSVYRVWNQRSDTNHRYTTDAATKQQMLAKGWLAEGYGPDRVAMCAVEP